jgi:molybdopterin converting factor small subunit
MQLKITYHGRLVELLDRQSEVLEINSETAGSVREELVELYVPLSESTFQIAQHNKIMNDSDKVTEDPIDIFPPFSGG